MMRWLDSPASETQIPHKRRLWLYALAGLVMVFLVIPTLIVIPMSFSGAQYLQFPPSHWSLRWYEHYFSSAEWLHATVTSLEVAFFTMLLTTPISVMAAYGLFVSRMRFAKLIYVALITPIIIPVILIAIGVFYAYVKLKLLYTIPGLVLADTVLAIPLVLIVVSSGLKSCDMDQEMAARSLGASRLKAFLLVTLPQIRFPVITGALLAFLTSFDEVVMALFISGGDHTTLTRKMFLSLRDQVDPTITSVSTLMIILSTGLLVAAQWFGRTRKS